MEPRVILPESRVDAFAAFVVAAEPRLRVALVAQFGGERGREATAEALAFGWENWDSVRLMEYPIAYLFKVGRSRTRPRGVSRVERATTRDEPPHVEPALANALDRLSTKQRMAVALVHGFGWTHAEAAEVMGVSEPTVKTHVQRGLAKLRSSLGVSPHG